MWHSDIMEFVFFNFAFYEKIMCYTAATARNLLGQVEFHRNSNLAVCSCSMVALLGLVGKSFAFR